ncbi:MAG: hypothetical protein QM703_22715 [Gemmatales bacterium]
MYKKISDPFDPKFIQQFNELQKAVESLYVSVAHPLEVVYRAGGQHLRLVPQEMDAVIVEEADSSDESDTDSDSRTYYAEEVFPVQGFTWHSESQPRRVTCSGYNRSSVPIGTYVRLYYTSAGDWRFVDVAGSGGGSSNSSDFPDIPTVCVRVLADIGCDDGATVLTYVKLPVLANVDCPDSSDSETVGG